VRRKTTRRVKEAPLDPFDVVQGLESDSSCERNGGYDEGFFAMFNGSKATAIQQGFPGNDSCYRDRRSLRCEVLVYMLCVQPKLNIQILITQTAR
jgi:hypothetical protein